MTEGCSLAVSSTGDWSASMRHHSDPAHRARSRGALDLRVMLGRGDIAPADYCEFCRNHSNIDKAVMQINR